MPTHTQHRLVTRTHFLIHDSSSIDLKILFKTKLLLTDKDVKSLQGYIYTHQTIHLIKGNYFRHQISSKINPEGN